MQESPSYGELNGYSEWRRKSEKSFIVKRFVKNQSPDWEKKKKKKIWIQNKRNRCVYDETNMCTNAGRARAVTWWSMISKFYEWIIIFIRTSRPSAYVYYTHILFIMLGAK